MRRRRSSLVMSLLLFGGVLLLGMAVIEEARRFGRGGAVESAGLAAVGGSAADDAVSLAAPPAVEFPEFATYGEVLGRPIFAPTRRPPERPEPAVSAPVPLAEPGMRLHGIVGFGSTSVALLAPIDGAALRRVGVGDDVDGWRVEEIGAGGVLLRRGARTHLLRLDYSGAEE